MLQHALLNRVQTEVVFVQNSLSPNDIQLVLGPGIPWQRDQVVDVGDADGIFRSRLAYPCEGRKFLLSYPFRNFRHFSESNFLTKILDNEFLVVAF